MGRAGELFTAVKTISNRQCFTAGYIVYSFAKSQSRYFHKYRLYFLYTAEVKNLISC